MIPERIVFVSRGITVVAFRNFTKAVRTNSFPPFLLPSLGKSLLLFRWMYLFWFLLNKHNADMCAINIPDFFTYHFISGKDKNVCWTPKSTSFPPVTEYRLNTVRWRLSAGRKHRYSKAVMGKLRPAGQIRPPEVFYPARATLFLIWRIKKNTSQFEPNYEKLLEMQSQFHSSHSPS